MNIEEYSSKNNNKNNTSGNVIVAIELLYNVRFSGVETKSNLCATFTGSKYNLKVK